MMKIALLVLTVCCACSGASDNSIVIQAGKFSSLSRRSGSSYNGKTVELVSTQGQYVSLTIAQMDLDTATHMIRLSGTVDSVRYHSDVYRGESLQRVDIVIGYLQGHLRDSSWTMGFALDSLEQVDRTAQQKQLSSMSIQQHIDHVRDQNMGIATGPVPYAVITPTVVAHPSRTGKFEIKSVITRDAYLIIALPNGPASFHLIGSLLSVSAHG